MLWDDDEDELIIIAASIQDVNTNLLDEPDIAMSYAAIILLSVRT
jgi:hypothetical protein